VSSAWVSPVVLEGSHVRIEPLCEEHAEGLFHIGKDPSIWTWLTLGPFEALEDSQRYIAEAVAGRDGGGEFPFAVIERSSGLVVGSTRFLNIRAQDLTLEVGWTWYAPRVQRTAVNTECKLLLMTHAFEVLGANRLQLKTDSRNQRSQAAIARLGAVREGVLRQDTILKKDGYVRDSVYFSVLRSEWPSVKARLAGMLGEKAHENCGNRR
jgi:RimJ/RimL family protein N-acetyltransferase